MSDSKQDLIDSLQDPPGRPRAVSAALGGSGMSERRIFENLQRATAQMAPAPTRLPDAYGLAPETPAIRPAGRPVSTLFGGEGIGDQKVFPRPQAGKQPGTYPLRPDAYGLAPEPVESPTYRMADTARPKEMPTGYRLAFGPDDALPLARETETARAHPGRLRDVLGTEHDAAIEKERQKEMEARRKSAMADLPEAPKYRQPEYANANAPLNQSMQSSLGRLPLVGMLTNAFGPLLGVAKAFSETKKIEEDNAKKAAKALEDFTKALDRAEKQAAKTFRDVGLDPRAARNAASDWRQTIGQPRGGDGASLASAFGGGKPPVGSGLAGAMSEGAGMASAAGAASGIALAGAAMAAIPAVALGVVDAFKSVVSSAARYVEAFAPASVLVMNQAMRDLTAVIGVGLLPVVQMAARLFREVGARLLPVMNQLQPVVRELSNVFYDAASATLTSFGRMSKTLVPLADALVGVFRSFSSLAPAVSALAEVFNVAFKPLIPVLNVLAETIKVVTLPFAILGDLFEAGGIVLGAFMDAVESIGGALGEFARGFGDSFKNFGDGLRSGFQSLIRATVTLSMAFLKMTGILDTAFGASFFDKLIKGFKGPPRQSAEGLAAATDPRYSSFSEFGRLSAQESAFAIGKIGEPQKKTEDWLQQIAKDLESIKAGENNNVFADILAKAIERILPKPAVYAENFREGFSKGSGIDWLAEKIVEMGF